MVELCHFFLSFSDLSERNYNPQSFWIFLYLLKALPCLANQMISAIDILISVMIVTVQCANCQEWSGCLSSGAVHQVVLKNQALLR